jgi:hypothetical protein
MKPVPKIIFFDAEGGLDYSLLGNKELKTCAIKSKYRRRYMEGRKWYREGRSTLQKIEARKLSSASAG